MQTWNAVLPAFPKSRNKTTKKKINMTEKNKLSDNRLDDVSGGAVRPQYVSSFFCEKCGKTIRLNGVYTKEKAIKDHNQKVHNGK